MPACSKQSVPTVRDHDPVMTTPAVKSEQPVMPSPFNSIRVRLVIVFAILTIILTAMLSMAIGTATSREAEQQINLRLTETAADMRDRLDMGMFERYREIGHMAALLSHRQIGHLQGQRRVLDQMQDTYKDYAWIGVADQQGRVVAATQGVLQGQDVRMRPWWKAGLHRPYVGDLHEAVLLARLLPAQAGEPLRLVDIAFPILDQQGVVMGVIGAHLSWRWAHKIQQSVIQPSMLRDHLEALVLDLSGKVILGPPALLGHHLPLQFPGRDVGYQTVTFPDGQVWLTAYAKTHGYGGFPGLGWQVIVRQKASDALAPVQQMHRQIIGRGLLIACLFMGMGGICANWLSRPLLRLARAVNTRHSQPDAPIPILNSYREVALLSQALNEFVSSQQLLASELARSNTSLEKRVMMRTAELQRSEEVQIRQTQLLHLILDSMSDGVIAVDRDGQAILINTAAAAVCEQVPVDQWRTNAGQGSGFFEVDMETRYADNRLPLVCALAGHEVSVEGLVLKHPAWPEPVWLQVHARPLKDATGASFGAVLVFRNVSEQRVIEQMKSEFVSVVSHELRTPLTSIHGALGLLGGGLVGEMPDKARPLLGIALENSDRLIRLINDILDIQKLDAGRLALDIGPLDLRLMAEQAVFSARGLEEKHQMRFRFQSALAAAWVCADADRLMQAMVNLLSNSAKFSPAGAEVQVQVERYDTAYRFSVSDCGPGIPVEFRKRIFGRFAQANAADTRQKGGTGLGLSITRSLIEQMGGRIGFESQPHVRTQFFIDMPIAERAGPT